LESDSQSAIKLGRRSRADFEIDHSPLCRSFIAMKRSMQLGLATLAFAFLSSITIVEMAPGSSWLLLLFTAAFGYLFFPNVIQSLALRAVQLGTTSRSGPLVAFVSSAQYLTVIRAVGFLAGSVAVYRLIESFTG
jgi:hypothetical protein